jgi:hypothetical protein
MNLTRLTRLLQMIGLLQGGKGHNVDSLAAHCRIGPTNSALHLAETFFLPLAKFHANPPVANGVFGPHRLHFVAAIS